MYGKAVLRVEQIGPDLWHTAMFRDRGLELFGIPPWECDFCRCSDENTPKQHAVAMAKFREESEPEPRWDDLSRIVSDEDWAKTLRAQKFPGYRYPEGATLFPDLITDYVGSANREP